MNRRPTSVGGTGWARLAREQKELVLKYERHFSRSLDMIAKRGSISRPSSEAAAGLGAQQYHARVSPLVSPDATAKGIESSSPRLIRRGEGL